jgi:putative nucleotidyltransferase with HDIG domain
MTDQSASPRPVAATVIAVLIAVAGLVGFGLSDLGQLFEPVTIALVACAIVSEFISARYTTDLVVSAAFVAGMLAVGFVGPGPAFAVPALVYITTGIVNRQRRNPGERLRVLADNLAGSATPTLLAALVFQAIDPEPGTAGFIALLVAVALATMVANALIVVPLTAMDLGHSIRQDLRAITGIAPAVAINIALLAAIAEIYAELGLTALIFVLLNVIAFTYMMRLLIMSRDRTREYANLSWGVLSGLIRTLDERDSRAARHCAAVASFSRDIAKHTGMNKRDQELAHTAGLLHDIGKFALSDRVMERGGQLQESDWRGIRRHPDIGAELLRDIGVYGPVAEIIREHHERIDGRGYPRGLRGDAIQPIAKIVAVAEVYDTLTAPDTYRTPMTSFEALNELRRVSGHQLDAVYVEALAELLAGRGTDYRHADDADFDRELDIERRMNEAVSSST